MILLTGHSLTPARKVPVEAMSIQLKERDSTATLTPADMTGIGVNSWLKDEGNPGNGIVWRVKAISQAYATQTPTVNLEHAINTLKDQILFGTHGPAQITGNSQATTCTALQAIRYILSQQSDWTLGSFPYNIANPYKFDGDSLFDALETVTDSLEDAWWSYDFSTYPFRLNITQKSSAVASELRANRNLRTITKTIDKSGMYTRFYPIGANDLTLAWKYLEKNTELYGVISKVETDNSIDTTSELNRWAMERLSKHSEPTVTIDVDGMELADATGESMDRLTLGTLCRIPLPEYGTTIQERIVSLSYQDKVHQPEIVKVTLSNNRTDITKIIADNMKKGGRSSRASAKRDKEDLAWFEDTNDHVAMCAKGIIGVDAQGNPNWVRLSQLVVDGNGLASTVSSVQNDVVIAQSQIKQTETSISMVVKRKDTRPISYFPKKAYFPKTGDPNKLYFAIDESRYYEWSLGTYRVVNPDLLIDASAIVTSINEAGESEAHIDADKVYIGNDKSTTVIAGKCKLSDVTADYIEGKIATLPTLRGISASFSGNVSAKGAVMAEGLYIGSAAPYQTVSDAIKQLQIVPVAGSPDTYVLQKKDFDDADWVDVGTFDHATSTSLSGDWSSNTYTVTASPQGLSKSVTPKVHIQTGTETTVHMNIGEMNSGSWTDHDGDEYAYLVRSGRTVRLRKYETGESGNLTYGEITIPAAVVTGTWNSSTWTATSTLGGSDSVTPKVHILTGTEATVHMKIGTMTSGSWTDHDGDEYAYLVRDGRTIYLKKDNSTGGSGNLTYGQITIPSAVVTGTWTSNTWRATSTLGGADSVTPFVHILNGNTTAMTAKIGTITSGSWTDHDGAAYAYLVKDGLTVYLRSQDSVSGGATYAQITVDNPYPNTITMTQKANARGDKQFTAYYMNGSSYVSMGLAYWYSSSKNLNVTSKTLRY